MINWVKSSSPGGCLVRITGDVDLTSEPELATLERELESAALVVLDLAGLKHSDTTFLRFLIRLRAHANKTDHPAVRLVGVGRNLQRVLDVTGLSRVFAHERVGTISSPSGIEGPKRTGSSW